MTRRSGFILIALTGLAVAAVALRLIVGPDGIDPPRDGLETRLRAHRAASAAVVGAALAASGVMLQSLLRNPLAAPAVLGLTAGAGLGVTTATYIAFVTTGAVALAGASIPAALIGSLGALAVVYSLAQRRGVLEPVTLILVGVVVSILCGAGTVLLQHLMPDQGLAATTRWLFGSIRDDTPTALVGAVGAVTCMGIALGAALGRAMDAASLSDDEAFSVGLRLNRLRLTLFVTAGLLTAGSVIIAGPVGFVGLICPHAVRLIAGPSHRRLIIGAALLGAALVVGADALIRLIDLGGGRMPVGVLTALLGGPTFIWLLRARWVRA